MYYTSRPAGPVSVPKQRKLLLVEDHAATRSAMGRLLRETGAVVVSARDGREALQLMMAERFDTLVTDLHMPVMDGFDLIHELKHLPTLNRPHRVIAISGEYEPGVLRHFSVSVGFLQKPFALDDLLQLLVGKPN